MRNKNTVITLIVIFGAICAWNLWETWNRFSIESELSKLSIPQQEKKLADPAFKQRYENKRNRSFSLGLDLQGGIFVQMEVGVEDILRQYATFKDPNFESALTLALTKKKESSESLVNLFVLSLKELAGTSAPPKLTKYFTNKDIDVKYNATDEEVVAILNDRAESAVKNTYEKIRTRVDQFGVSSPNLQMDQRTGKILLELPGLKESDSSRVYTLLRSTAKLEFWKTIGAEKSNVYLTDIIREVQIIEGVKKEEVVDSSAASDSADGKTGDSLNAKIDSPGVDTTAAGKSAAEDAKNNPFVAKIIPVPQDQRSANSPLIGYVRVGDTAQMNAWLRNPKVKEHLRNQIKFLYSAKPEDKETGALGMYAIETTVSNKPILDGSVITDARREFNQMAANRPEVAMSMSTKGAQEWARITGNNVGSCIAIVMDDLVYSAPVVQGQIPNGHSQISGSFTDDEALLLANLLKAGSLPVRAKIIGIESIGPTMGSENLSKGMLSFLIAFVVTIGFLAFYYTGAGLIANVAMICNLFFLLGVSAALGVVMTLPGIAAIVLTMGMAVDTNVLIFERIREEQALGKSLKAGIQAGFKNAFSSVMDSNITTFLTGVVLFAFGVGPIRGFAVTLMIGIITSLICGLLITRLFLEMYANRGNESLRFGNNFTSKLFANVDLKMTKRKRGFYILSGVMITLCIISFATFGFKTGVDFQGGYQFKVSMAKSINPETIRQPLTGAFNNNSPIIKTVGTSNDLMITTSYAPPGLSDQQQEMIAIEKLLTTTIGGIHPDSKPTIAKRTAVGPNVADDIKRSALWSVVFSLLVIFAYILIRFRKWQFSAGAIVSLFHDTILVLGVFSLLGHFESLPFSAEIDQTFIAALLTIIGYSINDTVVVYDRIRENMTEMKTSDLGKIFDHSLNQTFKRTMVTSFTTIITTLILFFVGGEVTKGFMLAMFVGIVTGTYSSVFVASPIALDLDAMSKKPAPETSEAKG
jgi:SecD/SecF fusion protein